MAMVMPYEPLQPALLLWPPDLMPLLHQHGVSKRYAQGRTPSANDLERRRDIRLGCGLEGADRREG